MDLNQLLIFARIVEHQSFTKAAKNLGIDKSTISNKLSQLESRLGVRLLNRSTRSVTLTEAGAKYYEYCRQAVEIAEEAESFSSSLGDEATGMLRISATNTFSQTFIESAIKPFMDIHSKISVELVIENRTTDFYKDNIDVALRLAIGPLQDSSLIAIKIFTADIGLYCSPSFIKMNGALNNVDQMDGSNFLGLNVPGSPRIILTKGAVSHKIPYKDLRFKVNDGVVLKEAAIAGLGIGYMPKHSASNAVKNKELVEIFSDWKIEPVSVYAVYASREWMPEKLRVFLKYLKELDNNLLK
jgi:DNA-binding transcriptional LysR family regulator|tara:strand:+ start:313 stop:1209 length:897 start_codon:yes stop_codon:yes gene_type:complete